MIYELKEYFPKEGCFDALAERFQTHTLRIFKKLNIEFIDVWMSEAQGQKSLVYIVRFQDEDDKAKKWQAFADDEEWINIKRESEQPRGALMANQTSKILTELPTYGA